MTDLNFLTEKIIKRTLELGADMSTCSAAVSVTREFNVDGGRFSLFRTLFNNSLSVTVFKEGKKGSVGINRFDEEAIEEALNNCFDAAKTAIADKDWGLCEEPHSFDITDGAPEPDTNLLFERSEELKRDIAEKYPKILIEQMIVTHTGFETVTRTSYGGHFRRKSGDYNLSLMFSAHEGEAASSFFGDGFVTASLDRPFLSIGSVAKSLADVEKQIYTEPLEGKFVGTMVLPPDSLGEFVGSALGSFAGSTSIIDGTSIWKDSLGKKVADERLTISSKPNDSRIVGAAKSTGDGFIAEDYDIIKDGVLESFMLTLYSANKTGHKRAANDSFDLVIKNGDTPYDEIIKSIDRGILVGRFSGGDPNSKGDFSGVAKNSFLIENGRITKALRETMINGNLADLLMNVKAVSKEVVENGYSVMPTVAFNGVTISGK